MQAIDHAMMVNGQEVKVLAERDPARLPWKELGVDIVIEASGRFTDRDQAAMYLDAGAARVVLTAPAKSPDLPHKDLRRARAAALSMIPTTTGAATAVGMVLPQLTGKLDGLAIRLPVPNVSLVDLVAEVERDTSRAEVNEALRKAAEGSLRGILAYSEAPLLSVDFNRNPHSAIVDAEVTNVIDRRLVKVMAWYDNQWGYACRVRDLVEYLSRR